MILIFMKAASTEGMFKLYRRMNDTKILEKQMLQMMEKFLVLLEIVFLHTDMGGHRQHFIGQAPNMNIRYFPDPIRLKHQHPPGHLLRNAKKHS